MVVFLGRRELFRTVRWALMAAATIVIVVLLIAVGRLRQVSRSLADRIICLALARLSRLRFWGLCLPSSSIVGRRRDRAGM